MFPNYSATSFTQPYWKQLQDARTNAINNVDFKVVSNADFNNHLNTRSASYLSPTDISPTAGVSRFNLGRKQFGNFYTDFVDKDHTVQKLETSSYA
jgi:hypothetical protein